ncbi:MAG: hypothetical protein P0Y64_17985 [Candidatus Sphingomonas colombiensis]|nr:hypothetical protein [Sphingomonas sp.]WEK43189.1 MAG: hypothetical protein P0Y64_17985 [Sphingomonas sp.]
MKLRRRMNLPIAKLAIAVGIGAFGAAESTAKFIYNKNEICGTSTVVQEDPKICEAIAPSWQSESAMNIKSCTAVPLMIKSGVKRVVVYDLQIIVDLKDNGDNIGNLADPLTNAGVEDVGAAVEGCFSTYQVRVKGRRVTIVRDFRKSGGA